MWDKPWMACAGIVEGSIDDSEAVDDRVGGASSGIPRIRHAEADAGFGSLGMKTASLFLLLALVPAGCAHVATYEREQLAHPTMTASDLARASEGHVRAVQEGAVGGDASAGGGCGCN